MKKILALFLLFLAVKVNSQLLSTNPSFVTDNSTGSIVITADLAKGNGAITNFNDVVIHTGVITSKSTTNTDWKYSKFPWPGNAATNAAAKCTPIAGTTKVTFTITNGLRNFYGITDATEKILKIALLFRNAAGTTVQRNFDGSDMYIPVYDNGLAVRIDQPFSHPTFNPLPEAINISAGQQLAITANASAASTLKLFLNGNQIGTTVSNGTTISANPIIAAAGNQEIVAEAVAGGVTRRDTMKFVIAAANNVQALPAGIKDGINYDPADPTTATLVLFAPQKQNVFVIGDFTNWERRAQFQMNVTPDNNRYWIKLTGLTPGVEYAYQFVIDGSLTVADYNTEKVLDPWNDKWIPATTYPNLKPYPEGKTSGIVSVLQTAKPAYNWKITNFQRPTQHNLIAYEMHMRDFLHTQSYKSLLDTLDYIKNLGMNCVKFMPINEFEGNNSWGYNPNFYFAVDKAYGTEDDFRRVIDACHEKGMAVVIDMVLNHSFGSSPMVQMYWNAAAQKPAANSPWFFPDARHPFNVGFDMNHDLSNQATKDFVDRVMEHWLVKYKVDGFRWDLSKGFTPLSMNTADIGVWNAFSQARIDIWKRIYDKMQQIAPGSYCILEHLGDNGEEAQLGNYGMMLWGKMTDEFNNATMGFPNNGDLTRAFDRQFWNKRNLVSYMESHDEERLAYKNAQFGANPGIKSLSGSTKRLAAATALFASMPGPKMVWQFGELAYDFSINTCEDLTIKTDCRTSPKPIRWNYFSDVNRKGLYDVYSKLFRMRNIASLVPTFTDGSLMNGATPTYSLTGEVKQLRMFQSNMSIVAFANFATGSRTQNIDFPGNGTWYKVVGTTGANQITVSGFSNSFAMATGDYAVYTNKDVDALLLPVVWTSFTGTKLKDAVELKWSVSSETNNKLYEIERSSDGVNYTKIGTQQSGFLSYTFVDAAPLSVNYYRIKQVDNDGTFSYSSVVKVSMSAATNAKWQLYPNPVKNAATLKLNEDYNNVSIVLTDVTGKVLYNQNFVNARNGQTIAVPVSNLTNGVYWIRLTSEKGTFTEKMVKN